MATPQETYNEKTKAHNITAREYFDYLRRAMMPSVQVIRNATPSDYTTAIEILEREKGGHNTKAELLEEDLRCAIEERCAIEDLAWWIKENLDDCPIIFRNDQLQAKLYKTYKEYTEE